MIDNIDNINNIDNEELIQVVTPIDFEKQKQEARELEKILREKGGKYDPVIITKNGDVKAASELNIDEQEHEIIKCATDPIYFIETYLTIFDQTQGDSGLIVPFKLFPDQKNTVNAYKNNRFNVVNKYRQGGLSTVTCAYISHYIMFNSNRSVAVVANLLTTAQNELMTDVCDFIDSCPDWLRPKPDKKNTQKLKIYDNGSKIAAFATTSGLRGYTPTFIFWDETAWTENSEKFWTSTQPTLQTGGRAIFVSTPNGYDPIFYKHFDLAKKKKNDFNAIELYWYNDPRYNIGLEWVKNKDKTNEIRIKDENWTNEKRTKMQIDGWKATSPWFEEQVRNANGDMRKIAQELLCSFLGSGDNFIAENFLKNIEDNQVIDPIRKEYIDNEMWIWEDPNPDDLYILILDVSSGHGEDFSTINILKIKEYIEEKIQEKNGIRKKIKIKIHKAEQVAEYYNKITPQLLADLAYNYAIKYNDAYVVVDITGGYGIYSIEKLFEKNYDNLYYSEVEHKQTRERLNGYIKSETKIKADGSVYTVDLIPGFFIGNNRAQVLINLQNCIHQNYITIRSSRTLNEFKTFVNKEGGRVADHRRSFHDDSIMGVAMGLFVLSYDTRKFLKNTNEKVKKMLNAILTTNDMKNVGENLKKSNNVFNKKVVPHNYIPHMEHFWVFKK